MYIDLLIVLVYFTVVFIVALSGKVGKDVSIEDYFLSSRNLRWPSIAFSTIATNIQGYQFLGMMGSAYLFGLAQANLEINAMQGILMAAFLFVPLYLRDKVITVTQFIKKRLGNIVGLCYVSANILLLSTIGLGAALFWGAYAADVVFGDMLSFIHENRLIRIGILIAALGIYSALYTYFGGLAAVVKTDIVQFIILLSGGILVLVFSVNHLGGWSQLYEKTPELMHLHLPASHPTLPWVGIGGMFLLNINYWCANQVVIQRSLAARSLKDAQVGLMVGGVMKYFMAIIIIVPGIALAGILEQQPLSDPDMAFPYLVANYLPLGIRGFILCALLASLMSTVDSTFNSLSTLWSIDIYKTYINKNASDRQTVAVGRRAILFTLTSGVLMGCVLLYLKFNNPEAAFTHQLNELRYYINCGIVVLICAAAFLIMPEKRLALAAFLSTMPLHLLLQAMIEDMNYLVRAMWVIIIAFGLVAIPSLIKHRFQFNEWPAGANKKTKQIGWGLLASLALLHIVFH